MKLGKKHTPRLAQHFSIFLIHISVPVHSDLLAIYTRNAITVVIDPSLANHTAKRLVGPIVRAGHLFRYGAKDSLA